MEAKSQPTGSDKGIPLENPSNLPLKTLLQEITPDIQAQLADAEAKSSAFFATTAAYAVHEECCLAVQSLNASAVMHFEDRWRRTIRDLQDVTLATKFEGLSVEDVGDFRALMEHVGVAFEGFLGKYRGIEEGEREDFGRFGGGFLNVP
jgi:hypothetical protein